MVETPNGPKREGEQETSSLSLPPSPRVQIQIADGGELVKQTKNTGGPGEGAIGRSWGELHYGGQRKQGQTTGGGTRQRDWAGLDMAGQRVNMGQHQTTEEGICYNLKEKPRGAKWGAPGNCWGARHSGQPATGKGI